MRNSPLKAFAKSPLKLHKPGHKKGTPKGGGFRDWPKGEEPPKKKKIAVWDKSTGKFKTKDK